MAILSRKQLVGQSTGNLEFPVNDIATLHQIALKQGTGTSGTLALKGIAWGNTAPEIIRDAYGAAITFDLAAPVTKFVEGSWSQFVFEPTTVNGNYTVSIADFE